MPRVDASFRIYRHFWRSLCENLSMRQEKPSRDAGMGYMHTVIRGNVGHSPSEKTQTDSVSSYGREPVYLQCHHSDPR